MSTSTLNNTVRLNVEINGKMYALSCEVAEEKRLKQVAEAVDARVCCMAEKNGISGQAAILLSLLRTEEELMHSTEENAILAQRIVELSALWQQTQETGKTLMQNTSTKQVQILQDEASALRHTASERAAGLIQAQAEADALRQALVQMTNELSKLTERLTLPQPCANTQ